MLLASASTDGRLDVRHWATGRRLAAFRLAGDVFSSPAVSDDGHRLVVGCRDNFVYCLQLDQPPVASWGLWPPSGPSGRCSGGPPSIESKPLPLMRVWILRAHSSQIFQSALHEETTHTHSSQFGIPTCLRWSSPLSESYTAMSDGLSGRRFDCKNKKIILFYKCDSDESNWVKFNWLKLLVLFFSILTSKQSYCMSSKSTE